MNGRTLESAVIHVGYLGKEYDSLYTTIRTSLHTRRWVKTTGEMPCVVTDSKYVNDTILLKV